MIWAPDVALLLCYTAMFHSARAVLFRDGVKERSHICIINPELRSLANTLDTYGKSRCTTLCGPEDAVSKKEADASQEEYSRDDRMISDHISAPRRKVPPPPPPPAPPFEEPPHVDAYVPPSRRH